MHLRQIWLGDFRSYASLDLELPAGLCAIRGPNGVGKSNLLEAVGYLATLGSFRGAPGDAMVRMGAESAVIRGEVDHDGRVQLVEAELNRNGRNRVQVNRQRLQRSRDLLGVVRTTVFSPDDLALVKGGPGLRRGYLDDLLVALHPRNDEVRSQWERSLRQRNALLKQVHGRLDEAAELTLEVWDTKAADSGGRLVSLRRELTARLGPSVRRAYRELAGDDAEVTLSYETSWQGDFAEALHTARNDDLRRGVTTVGPHRDELRIILDGLPARTHSSQGEQRCLALALRLAGHREVAQESGSPPILLLDDVFSELDAVRSSALVESLPPGQAFLSSAAPLPESVHPEVVFDVTPGSARRAVTAGE